ncbi:MAG: S-layer homology domain-containing protein [Oscillospiraceae bacterium]|nr:S-layer homology domain-containing protein [Oscillospiraceae bacterium]
MRNLKKILALALALVMSFSLMSVSSAAFKDEANVNDTFAEAVEVLSGLKVFEGYEDGSFKPQGSITRAEVAAIIYRVVTGDVDDKQVGIYADYNVFSDVKSTAWYAGYVNYCANAQYIKGYGDGKFGPNDPVTGYQALAMILRAIGYDKNNEFSGAAWQVETAKVANQRGITKNVKASTLGVAATREVVAEVLFRTIMVPQVSYTLALGYSLYSDVLQRNLNDSLAFQNFKLEKLTGEITAVGRTANTTTLEDVRLSDETTVSVAKIKNTNTSWESIGYEGYVYAVPTTSRIENQKTWDAVTEVKVTGESLLVSTNGTSFDDLLDDVDLDEVNGVTYYYNGVELPTATMSIAAAKDKVGEVGVKVDFIDNDAGEKAEVVVVTEYTATHVSGIANESNTGANAIKKDYFYFKNGKSYKAANVVCASELAYDDLITYVEYNKDAYVVVAPSVTGEFTKIINASNAAKKLYVVGGVEYLAANDLYTNNTDNFAWLNRANFTKDALVYTDPYGYMLQVGENVAAAQYLYVVRTNHSDNVAGTTYATVVFADGTLDNVYVKRDDVNTFNSTVPSEMYTYTVNDKGVYVLTQVCNDLDVQHIEPASYVNTNKNVVTLTDGDETYYLTKTSVVVDLRAQLSSKRGEVKVYTGYAEMPSVTGAEFHVVADRNDFVKLAFLTNGDYAELAEKSFVLYDAVWEWDTTEDGKKVYFYDAIVDGVATQVKLTAEEKDAVEFYGVGIYDIKQVNLLMGGLYSVVSYTSFMEDWKDITWKDGAIIVDGVGYAYDAPFFFTLDIASGKAWNYLMVHGEDKTNAKAIVEKDTKGNVEEIYVVFGELAPVVEENAKDDGSDNIYYVQKGYVTTLVPTAKVAAYEKYVGMAQKAFDAIDYANSILNGTAAVSNVEDVLSKENSYADRIVFARDLLAAAKADLEIALNGLAQLLAAETNEDLAEMVENLIDEADEAKFEAAVTINKVESSDAFVLAEKKNAAGEELVKALDSEMKAVKGADKVYGVQGDVYVTDSDAAIEVSNNKTEIIVDGKATTLYSVVQGWFRAINAATEKELETVKVELMEKVQAVAKAYVTALIG